MSNATNLLTSTQLTTVVEEMVHAVRGIESASVDNMTANEFLKRTGYKATFGQRCNLGRLSGAFSLAAGRPVLFSNSKKYPARNDVRLHAPESLMRAAEHLGLKA